MTADPCYRAECLECGAVWVYRPGMPGSCPECGKANHTLEGPIQEEERHE